jgi:hypothetical protein
MSTTPTKKDVKEVAKEIAAMETVINNLSYSQLTELLKEKKDKEIESVTHKLKEATGIVVALEAQLENLGVVTASAAPVKRGRKIKNNLPPKAKAPKKAKGKRGAVGEAITKFVSSKGKAGAKVSEIATALKMKPANITAFFYAKANKKKFKNLGKATFIATK